MDAFTGLIDRDDHARSFAEIACLNAKTSALQRDQRSSSFKYAGGSTGCALMIADATPRLVAGRSATLATLVGARSRTVAYTAASGAGSRSSTAGRTSRAATGTLRP